MFGLGSTEILLILLVVLVIFGSSRIPALGRGLGEGLKNFRQAMRPDTKKKLPGQNSETHEALPPNADDS